MITNLRRHRSAWTAPMQAPTRSRPGVSAPGIRDAAVAATSDGRVEPTLQLLVLEAEVLGLRQNLAEVVANRDALRKEMDDLLRDRDHWRGVTEPGEPKSPTRQKTWFCGRAAKPRGAGK